MQHRTEAEGVFQFVIIFIKISDLNQIAKKMKYPKVFREKYFNTFLGFGMSAC
jgi:hypothetical protein